MKSTLLNIHFFVREKNIEITFPQSKNGKIPDKLRKKVTVVILGILTLLNILVLGVGLKFRSKELELEADIW